MKKMLLAAGSLFGLALAQTSCQAPAPPAPKSEPIAAGQATTARKSEPTKPTSQPAAQRKVVVRQAPLFPASFTRFIEKPHLRKVKYGKHRWVMV